MDVLQVVVVDSDAGFIFPSLCDRALHRGFFAGRGGDFRNLGGGHLFDSLLLR